MHAKCHSKLCELAAKKCDKEMAIARLAFVMKAQSAATLRFSRHSQARKGEEMRRKNEKERERKKRESGLMSNVLLALFDIYTRFRLQNNSLEIKGAVSQQNRRFFR